MSKLTAAEQDLVDRFDSFTWAEKAAALRDRAREETGKGMQEKLIRAALLMDACAALETDAANGPWSDG